MGSHKGLMGSDKVLTRRSLLRSLPALAMMPLASRALAQTAPIRVRGINHVTLSVSDVKRSVDFYQGLFGMPVISRQGMTTNLQIGAGPQFLGVSSAGAGRPGINHICLGVDDFNVDRITAALGQRGITRTDEAGNAGGGGLGGGPMKMRVRMRGPDTGGTREGTPELYFSDPDGVVMQLQDPRYCGGGGALGNVCAPAEPSPKKGLIALRGWSHCTIFGSDGARANSFYQDLLGLRVQAHQGPTAPVLGVGGVQFLMFAGGAGRGRANTPAPGRQHQPSLHEHGRLQPGRRHQDARKLRHQAARQRPGARGPARALHQHADGEPRRRERRHAGAVFHRP